MGCGQSAPVEDNEARARSDAIEKQLKQAERDARQDVKLLFLGAGALRDVQYLMKRVAESTVLKQFRLMYDKPMEHEERLGYREVILANTFQSLSVVLDAMEMMGIQFDDPESANEALIMSDIGSYPEWPVPQSVAKTVKNLYADAGVKDAIAKRSEFQLGKFRANLACPSCPSQYFFENVERTIDPNFIPSDDDILRCRVKTTGISETILKVGDLRYRLLDVGGQRTERRKWLNCFEDVTVLLFLVAIQEFDQSLYEDESVNRLQESVTLFESVANSRYFANTSIILFLNKIDLFASKLRAGTKLVDYCPDYAGPNEFEPASQYMAKKFRSLYRRPQDLYQHLTCATVRVVLISVNDTILRKNLTYSGLM
ncbi:hypothetical protein BT93_L4484 [Corymbia citriodora subsp. variegata]|uniref:Uncharacterized protein n=1 Tax=Corymbia citriodora subsp. variegata TaxID=360336 RepID=A0A8T0CFY0_CORYI|nr:hypothetical protein BT93_L4484 [Corymbia citriodora subsp. variegata]